METDRNYGRILPVFLAMIFLLFYGGGGRLLHRCYVSTSTHYFQNTNFQLTKTGFPERWSFWRHQVMEELDMLGLVPGKNIKAFLLFRSLRRKFWKKLGWLKALVCTMGFPWFVMIRNRCVLFWLMRLSLCFLMVFFNFWRGVLRLVLFALWFSLRGERGQRGDSGFWFIFGVSWRLSEI